MRLLKLFSRFTHSAADFHSLETVISPHILKILQQDQADANSKYVDCVRYMKQVSQKTPSMQARVKCNLLFSANSLCDSLLHLRGVLSQLIINENIKNQYELDQLIKWLTKEIKINKNVGYAEIGAKMDTNRTDTSCFEQEISQLQRQQPKCSVSQVCKTFRQKFPNIDSKVIYQRITKVLKCVETIPKKQNKLWDKLLEIKPRQLKLECNSKQIYEQHLKITGGKPRFRFPPEPNGFLHIGHVKSIRVNFQSALRTGGTCYLRYDDTNPDKESHEFIKQIEENVRWLGYTPDRVTFASDYFEQLQGFALQLIKNGQAYVCQSSQDQIQAERKNKSPNPYRQRRVQSSLKIFPNLSANQTLRLKGVYDSANPTLRDPILYRLKQKAHPRTGNRFKIYPMYDFTHGICDSLQHIDYSFCSLQFEVRRQLYYLFLDLLGLFKPVVWEYSRLNIEGNVLSKRKIKEFIEKKVVDGWEDPRLLTIRGLKNRGYTPQMLKQFIDKVNCSRSGNENLVQYSLLEKQMKKTLLKQSYKAMGVLRPYLLNVIQPPAQMSSLQQKSKETQTSKSNIFIDESDAEKLTEGELVILKHRGIFQYNITNNGPTFNKAKQQDIPALRKVSPHIKILHWVHQSDSVEIKTVLYEKLLDAQGEPNPNSKAQYLHSRIPRQLLQNKEQYIQLQKIGYFKFSEGKQSLHLCTLL